MITHEQAKEWSKKYMSRRARKTHPDHQEYMRRTEYMINKLYSDFEKHIKSFEAQLANTEQLTCQQCKHFTEASNEDFESCTFDFDCRDDYKPVSRFEPKDTQ